MRTEPTERQKRLAFWVVVVLAYSLVATGLVLTAEARTAVSICMASSVGSFLTSLFMNFEHWFVGKGLFILHIFGFCLCFAFVFARF